MKLRTKILLFTAILLPVVLVSVYSYYKIRQNSIERIFDQRRAIVTMAEHVLQEKLGRISDLGLSFSTRPLVQRNAEAKNWPAAIDLMKRVPVDFTYIQRVIITDTNGVLMAQVPDNSTAIIACGAGQSWYPTFIKSHSAQLSPVYMNTSTPGLVEAAYIVPIKTETGQLCALMQMEINVAALLAFTGDIKSANLGYLYVTDSKGQLALTPEYTQRDSIIDYSAVPAVKKALGGKSGAEIQYNPVKKENRLAAYTYVPKYGWGVVLAQNSDEALALDATTRVMRIIYLVAVLTAAIFALVIMYQIDRRTNVESALQNSVTEIQEFKKLFEAAPGLFIVIKPDFTVYAVGEEYLQSAGLIRQQVIGRSKFEIYGEPRSAEAQRHFDAEKAAYKNILETKMPDGIKLEKIPVTNKNGVTEDRYWNTINKPVLNDKGEVIYIIRSAYEITEQLKHEAEIKRASAEIEELYNHAPCGYFSVDPSLTFCNINHTFLQWTGYTADELLSKKKFEEILTPPSLQVYQNTINDVFAQYLDKGYVNELEFELQRKDGTSFPVLINSVAVFDNDDNFVKSRSTVFDNTQMQKTTAELKAANKELEAFSYSISHDLRSPLRGISGYAQILLEDHALQLNPNATRLLKSMIYNAVKMGQLIDDLLSFSRLGRQQLRKVSVTMKALVNTVCEELKPETGNRNVVFTINSMPPALIDVTALKQVWINLVSNAIKYSALKEEAVIEIGGSETDTEVIFYVNDNGAGFDMRYVHKLFGVFQRLHSDREFKGTGVGLAIVHRIITKHGGRVWAESQVNHGATFYFAIPKNNG